MKILNFVITAATARRAAFVLAVAITMLGAGNVYAQTAAPAPKPVKTFTEKDREFALKYFNETRDDFNSQLNGLSDAQLNFRSAPGRWTIGEIAEHIIVTEAALFGMIKDQAFKTPAPAALNDFRINDIAVILAITNRSQKFTAPEQVRPNGRWKTREELLSNFGRTRAETIEFIKANKLDLRSYSFPTPAVGISDAFQAFLAVAGHSERHLLQLKEVKADAGYPKK